MLEWVAISFSRGSSRPRDRTLVSHSAGGLFSVWAPREAHESWRGVPFPAPGVFPTASLARGQWPPCGCRHKQAPQGAPCPSACTWGPLFLGFITQPREATVVHRLRIRLPVQGTQVRSPVQEDPTCHGATKPGSHNHQRPWTTATDVRTP